MTDSRQPKPPKTKARLDVEQQVATFAAQGLTNRAITERLPITPPTVKNHLSYHTSTRSSASPGAAS